MRSAAPLPTFPCGAGGEMPMSARAGRLRARIAAERPLRALRALWSDEAAPTSVEYALLVGGIAIVIVASVGTLGATVAGLFSSAAALWP